MAGQILVGTASWADPGFVEEWYPRGLPARDRLAWYARHFDLVEVNSTFYGVPERRTVERWAQQTPDGFLFDIKLHRLLSRHSAALDTLPERLQSKVDVHDKRVVLTPTLEEDVVGATLDALEPLRRAGKLGALLVQMSPEFSPRKHELGELDNLIRLLKDESVAVELRNRGWLTEDRLEDTLDFFEERGVSFVCVDAPDSDHFMVIPSLDVVTNPRLAYLRMHGRNREGYVRGRSVATRFDYDYSAAEIKEHAQRALDLGDEAAKVHVLYNNNKGAYAPQAAERLRRLLDQPASTRKAA